MIFQPKLDDLIRPIESKKLQLDKTKISILEGFDFFDDSILTYPNSSIIRLYYKDNLAGLLGFQETDSTLHINQIQGRRGKKGYKPLTCIEWERVLIRSFLKYGTKKGIDNFTSTSSILECGNVPNVQHIQRLQNRYDKPLREEGFSFSSSTYLFEY